MEERIGRCSRCENCVISNEGVHNTKCVRARCILTQTVRVTGRVIRQHFCCFVSIEKSEQIVRDELSSLMSPYWCPKHNLDNEDSE